MSHDVSKQTLFCKRHSGMVDGPVLLKSLRLLTWQLNTSHIHFCMFSHQCHRLVVRIRCRKSFHPLPHAEFDHSPAEERKKSHLAPLHLQDPPLRWVLPRAHKPSLASFVLCHIQPGHTWKAIMSLVGPASQALEDRALLLRSPTHPNTALGKVYLSQRASTRQNLPVPSLLISMLTPFHLQGLG